MLYISYNGSAGRALDFHFAFAQKLWCRDSRSTDFKIYPHRSPMKSRLSQSNNLHFLINPVSPIKWLQSAHYQFSIHSVAQTCPLSSCLQGPINSCLCSRLGICGIGMQKSVSFRQYFLNSAAPLRSVNCACMFSKAAYQVLLLFYILCVDVEAHREARKPHENIRVNFLEL